MLQNLLKMQNKQVEAEMLDMLLVAQEIRAVLQRILLVQPADRPISQNTMDSCVHELETIRDCLRALSESSTIQNSVLSLRQALNASDDRKVPADSPSFRLESQGYTARSNVAAPVGSNPV